MHAVARSIFRRGFSSNLVDRIKVAKNRPEGVAISNSTIFRTVEKIKIVAMPAESGMDRSYFVLPNHTPFCALDCKTAFDSLSDKERLYAHYLSQASWYGSLIVLHQTSPESPLIFALLNKVFKHQSLDELKKVALGAKVGMTEEEFKAFLLYAAGVFDNSGNYKGFGDTKILPNVEEGKLAALIKNTEAYKAPGLAELLSAALPGIYRLTERDRRLGLPDKGVTTYHSSNVVQADVDLVGRYMKANKLEAWNTRLFKTVDKATGKTLYEIRLASIEVGNVTGPEEWEGCLVLVSKGDYSPLLATVNHYLTLAKEHAANENETKMLENYIKHFQTGSLECHKDGSRFWIKDKGPVVESYIGFIENCRDPAGERAEFEGFVAIVNRSMSEKFARLVENAEKLLAYLPWDRAYEKNEFLRPDFTSLDVLSFGGSGTPAGINIPNYDEIRQNEGFKNVSLGNVIAATPNVKVTFLSPEDEVLFKTYKSTSFELQVGLHELLGHGSGKLFYHNRDGTFNFDQDTTKDMDTGEKVTSWYEEGETYSSKFGALGSAYEECRAEAVGYFLSTFPDVLKLFGFDDPKVADDIKYANWLTEHRAGLLGIEYYSPETKTWGQPHCHARYALLMVAIEAGNGFVEVQEFTNSEDGKPDLLITLDRSKIDTVGKSALAAFLKKLQLYKSTGDVSQAKALFDHYSAVTEKTGRWREIVIDRRQPRHILVMANTICKDGRVSLITYPESVEGAIQSYVDRYTDQNVIDQSLSLAKTEP